MTQPLPPEQHLRSEIEKAIRSPIVGALLAAADVVPLVLNRQRQIVAFHPEALQRLGVEAAETILGMRPGDVLECKFATREPGGCGTSRACQVCGIARAILESQQTGKSAEQEGLFTVQAGGWESPRELQVRAVPVELQGLRYTFLYLRDQSDLKRRQVLERVFLHDLKNTLSGIFGWTDMLRTTYKDVDPQVAERVLALTERLRQEIEGQRDLLDAESGTFQPVKETVRPATVLEQVRWLFDQAPVAADKSLRVEVPGDAPDIRSSSRLLLRVLTNLVKNAFEATEKGGSIRLSCEHDEQRLTFLVHNKGVIPEPITSQIFKRSFSTKAESGRGLGTYSAKLFGERYLGGEVGFRSSAGEGTVFWLALPR